MGMMEQTLERNIFEDNNLTNAKTTISMGANVNFKPEGANTLIQMLGSLISDENTDKNDKEFYCQAAKLLIANKAVLDADLKSKLQEHGVIPKTQYSEAAPTSPPQNFGHGNTPPPPSGPSGSNGGNDSTSDTPNNPTGNTSSLWNKICSYKWIIAGIAALATAAIAIAVTKPDVIFKNDVISKMSEKLFDAAKGLVR